jgi:hypothetical protein
MLKKGLKIGVLVLAIAFAAVQFYRPDQTNPRDDPAMTIEASMDIPEDVRMILGRSCADCHSNRTVYPWYSKITPVNWFLDSHVRSGRRELNISEWNTYESRKKIRKLDEVCQEVESGEMPLPSYLWIHWDAAMQPGDTQKLCEWANVEKARLQTVQPH